MEPERWQEVISRQTWLSHLRDQKAFDAELRVILRDAANEAESLIKRMVGDDIGTAIRRSQLQQSAFALRSIEAQMWDRLSRAMREGIERTSRQAVHGTMLINDVLAAALGSTDLGPTFLYGARASVENVRSRLINAIDLSPRVYKNRALSEKTVFRVVNRGIATGSSAAEIAKSVKHLIRPDTPGGTSFAARRLGRTELNNAFHTTTIRSVAEAPWMAGMKWELSNSHARSDECDDFAEANHDGIGAGVFRPEHTPGKPHPQCLCYVTTITVDREEFRSRFLSGEYDSYLGAVGL
jgi:hypothetical protein